MSEAERIPVVEALKHPGRLRIGLGLPSRDEVKMDYTLSLLGLGIVSSLIAEFVPLNPRSCYVQINRDDIVEAAIQERCDAILWIDADMEFPSNGLLRLLSHKVDIVGGTYVRRSEPYDQLMGKRVDGVAALAMEGLEEMVHIPAGFMLTKVDVFRKMPRPWFWLTLNEKTGKVDLGDDYYFCAKAREHGYKIWCDQALTAELVHHADVGLRAPRPKTFAAAAQ